MDAERLVSMLVSNYLGGRWWWFESDSNKTHNPKQNQSSSSRCDGRLSDSGCI